MADALGVQDIRLPLTPAKVQWPWWASTIRPRQRPELLEADYARPPCPRPARERWQGAHRARLGGSSTPRPKPSSPCCWTRQALAKVVPGCHALERTAENHYRADVDGRGWDDQGALRGGDRPVGPRSPAGCAWRAPAMSSLGGAGAAPAWWIWSRMAAARA
ncbi:hypothetical protein ACTMU2_19905 [Cupriavidus basilensis]